MKRWPSHGGRGLDPTIWVVTFRAFCCSISGYSCIQYTFIKGWNSIKKPKCCKNSTRILLVNSGWMKLQLAASPISWKEQDDLQQLKYTVEDYVHELESRDSWTVRLDLLGVATWKKWWEVIEKWPCEIYLLVMNHEDCVKKSSSSWWWNSFKFSLTRGEKDFTWRIPYGYHFKEVETALGPWNVDACKTPFEALGLDSQYFLRQGPLIRYSRPLSGQMSLPIREELKSTAPAWFQCNLLQHGRAPLLGTNISPKALLKRTYLFPGGIC